MNTRRIRTMDLFCGAGGSSHGAQNAGVEIIAGFDIWEPAIKTYQANFPQAAVYHKDITELNPAQVKKKIGNIDLMLASPECTSHSRAKGSAERSEDSRRTAFEVVRFASEFNPKWIVIENVVDMKSWGSYDKLLMQLRQLGYFVNDDVILNAKDFGVPQARERLFILCSRLGEPIAPLPSDKLERPVSSIISENTYHFTPLRKRGRAKATIVKADHAITNLEQREPFLIVYYGSGKNGNGGWQTIHEPLRTITTLDRFGYVIPYKNGHRMRMLQPEELKLAMGFNKDFKLDEVEGLTRRQRVKLMGNGVCPPVMEAIVKSLTSQQDH
ncbi:MAG: DNA cytosine methyltransferase [Ardenticatenaceae bacterium]|nr:DNA cytosine methyltransferase [Ardenticatenaceae bacterium]